MTLARFHRSFASTLSVAAFALTCSAAFAQTPRAVYLLDRSGSMLATTAGTARWEATEHYAKLDVDTFFSLHPSGEIQIREFLTDGSGFSGSRIIDFTPPGTGTAVEWISAASIPGGWTPTDYAQATVEAATPVVGGYLTPLADAICEATTSLFVRQAGPAGPSAEVYFFVYADGGENSSVGSCSGVSACNALTGRCDFDVFHPGAPWESPCGSTDPSWQQNACASINSVRALCAAGFCDFVFNVYKFQDFADDTINAGFTFLDSAARGTGGMSIEVDDGSPLPAVSAYVVHPIGCLDANGNASSIVAPDLPSIGNSVQVQVTTGYALDLLMLGVTEANPVVPLAALGAPGCVVGVQALVLEPLFVTQGNYWLQIPQNQSLLGSTIYMQGAGYDLSNTQTPPVVTTNMLAATIMP